jgi:uncharacterized protein (TIGR00730 family)
VITQQLVSAEVAHQGLTSLEVVADMHERKARFEMLAGGFIALPGGFGTVEELIELLTWNQLDIVRKPVVLPDVEQYWSSLFDWMDQARPLLAARGITLAEWRRDWDSTIWPHATAGFFKVKQQIPRILGRTEPA